VKRNVILEYLVILSVDLFVQLAVLTANAQNHVENHVQVVLKNVFGRVSTKEFVRPRAEPRASDFLAMKNVKRSFHVVTLAFQYVVRNVLHLSFVPFVLQNKPKNKLLI